MSTSAMSADASPASSEATAKATVNAFFDAYRTRDVERMVELCSDGADFRYVPFGVWAGQRVLHGDGKVGTVGKASWAALIDAFPDLTTGVARVRAAGKGGVAGAGCI